MEKMNRLLNWYHRKRFLQCSHGDDISSNDGQDPNNTHSSYHWAISNIQTSSFYSKMTPHKPVHGFYGRHQQQKKDSQNKSQIAWYSKPSFQVKVKPWTREALYQEQFSKKKKKIMNQTVPIASQKMAATWSKL